MAIEVTCPHCGPRGAEEFHAAGPPQRRPDPERASPSEWRAYLYLRPNPAGRIEEVWFHVAGCRRHLLVERDTATGAVGETRPYPPGGEEPTP